VAVLDRTVDSVPDDPFPVACDVSRSDEVASAVASVVEHFGSLDIVINTPAAASRTARCTPRARATSPP
jgi:NAD(P)-dependent dehydrogenase (short-subunit alcohol dehydrogenase family)